MSSSTVMVKHCGAQGRKGTPCKRPAGWGTDHVGVGRCKLHGGNLPNHKRAAARTMILQEAGATFGVDTPIDISPTEALLELVRMSAGYVRWLSGEVSRIRSIQEMNDVTGLHDPVVLVRLLGEYTDRLARFSKMTLDAGVEERFVRLAEAQGEMIAAVLVNVLGDLALTPSQQQAAPEVVRRHMMALEAHAVAK